MMMIVGIAIVKAHFVCLSLKGKNHPKLAHTTKQRIKKWLKRGNQPHHDKQASKMHLLETTSDLSKEMQFKKMYTI